MKGKKTQIEYTKLDSLCVVRTMEVNVHARIFCDCAKFFPRIFRLKSRLHIVIENRLIRYIHGNSLAYFTIFLFGAVNIWFVISIGQYVCCCCPFFTQTNTFLPYCQYYSSNTQYNHIFPFQLQLRTYTLFLSFGE